MSAARSCLGSHTERHCTECTLSEVPFPSQYFHTYVYMANANFYKKVLGTCHLLWAIATIEQW